MVFARTRHGYLRRTPTTCEVFLTKSPRDILLTQAALEQSPQLHVIFMLRDPHDVIVSHHNRNPNRYWAGLKFWKAYTQAARPLLGHPRFITLRYEELVSDPDATQRALAKRLPFLKHRAAFSAFHDVAKPSPDAVMALGGVREIAKERVANWRNHLPRVAGQIALHGSITGDLIEFGYEHDDTWLREIDGVVPDLTPSHWPEYFTENSLARMLQAP
ncbi:MAG: sulfotransferase [Proteobacteria bacterium]|nr:sulfotransferase [Pseudomonadota bacterium]